MCFAILNDKIVKYNIINNSLKTTYNSNSTKLIAICKFELTVDVLDWQISSFGSSECNEIQ